ncbi:MAG: hypothetical protein WA936_08060 [Erythrobacter sp.]|uniref:hypothetical protein n=1 Tax=Erythrobacter sp. TaxID=1042 RepID=UPI003C78EBA3
MQWPFPARSPASIVLALLAAAATLSGCAGDSDRYPSLAIRDAERDTGEIAPVPQPEVEPVVSTAALAEIVARAEGFNSRFESARPAVLRLARNASGAGPESEARARALVAIADLTSLHGRTSLALADIDRLEAEARTRFAPIEPIEEAQALVAQWVAAQDEALTNVETAAR